MPQARTRVRAWPDWGTGSGTSSTVSAHWRITAARIGVSVGGAYRRAAMDVA